MTEESEYRSPAKEQPLKFRLTILGVVWIGSLFVLNSLIQMVQTMTQPSTLVPPGILTATYFVMVITGIITFVVLPYLFVKGKAGLKYTKVLQTRPLEFYRKSDEYVILDENDNPVHGDS